MTIFCDYPFPMRAKMSLTSQWQFSVITHSLCKQNCHWSVNDSFLWLPIPYASKIVIVNDSFVKVHLGPWCRPLKLSLTGQWQFSVITHSLCSPKLSLISQWHFQEHALKLSLTGQWQFSVITHSLCSPKLSLISQWHFQEHALKLSLTGQWQFSVITHSLCEQKLSLTSQWHF